MGLRIRLMSSAVIHSCITSSLPQEQPVCVIQRACPTLLYKSQIKQDQNCQAPRTCRSRKPSSAGTPRDSRQSQSLAYFSGLQA